MIQLPPIAAFFATTQSMPAEMFAVLPLPELSRTLMDQIRARGATPTTPMELSSAAMIAGHVRSVPVVVLRIRRIRLGDEVVAAGVLVLKVGMRVVDPCVDDGYVGVVTVVGHPGIRGVDHRDAVRDGLHVRIAEFRDGLEWRANGRSLIGVNGHDRLDEADVAPSAERRGLVVGQVGRELVDVAEVLETARGQRRCIEVDGLFDESVMVTLGADSDHEPMSLLLGESRYRKECDRKNGDDSLHLAPSLAFPCRRFSAPVQIPREQINVRKCRYTARLTPISWGKADATAPGATPRSG